MLLRVNNTIPIKMLLRPVIFIISLIVNFDYQTLSILLNASPPLFPLVAYAWDVVEEAIFWHESTKIYSYVPFYKFCIRQSLACGLFWVLRIITKMIFFYTFKSFNILDRLWLCVPDCIENPPTSGSISSTYSMPWQQCRTSYS